MVVHGMCPRTPLFYPDPICELAWLSWNRDKLNMPDRLFPTRIARFSLSITTVPWSGLWQISHSANISLLQEMFQGPGRSGSTPEASCWSWKDRKSTRLNSSHVGRSYAVFWLNKIHN